MKTRAIVSLVLVSIVLMTARQIAISPSDDRGGSPAALHAALDCGDER
jgi:hypothetical protein